jgi:hypothetical protein
VVGPECSDAWIDEGARVLVRGQRLVLLEERRLPAGVAQLARGGGMTVGEKS